MEVSKSYLSEHFQRYHNSKTKTFSCTDCKKKYFVKDRLESHIITAHSRIMAPDNLCIVCGKTFVTPERLREHKANMHKIDQGTFSCTKCDKMFQNKALFKTHSCKYHLELPCLECEQKFGSKFALKAQACKPSLKLNPRVDHNVSVNLYGQLFFYWRKVYHTSVETIHISCRQYIWFQSKIKHRVGNPENICKLGWGSEVWSCGWDWDQIRNPNINNKEIIWLCNYHISL